MLLTGKRGETWRRHVPKIMGNQLICTSTKQTHHPVMKTRKRNPVSVAFLETNLLGWSILDPWASLVQEIQQSGWASANSMVIKWCSGNNMQRSRRIVDPSRMGFRRAQLEDKLFLKNKGYSMYPSRMATSLSPSIVDEWDDDTDNESSARVVGSNPRSKSPIKPNPRFAGLGSSTLENLANPREPYSVV
jgi:hypothetical protein